MPDVTCVKLSNGEGTSRPRHVVQTCNMYMGAVRNELPQIMKGFDLIEGSAPHTSGHLDPPFPFRVPRVHVLVSGYWASNSGSAGQNLGPTREQFGRGGAVICIYVCSALVLGSPRVSSELVPGYGPEHTR